MTYECEFCNKTYKSIYSLKTHQTTAKFCLNTRNTESNDHKCEYCLKIFTTKNSLNIHNQSCKKKIDYSYQSILKEEKEKLIDFYELKMKEKDKQNEKDKESIINAYKTIVTDKDRLLKEKDEQINKLLEEKNELIYKLQNQVKDLADKAIDKPTYDQRNTTNTSTKTIDNRVLNMVPMDITPEGLLKILQEKFTENHLMKGQRGVAEFCLENNILINSEGKFMMKCTDPSRKMFIYIDEDGKLQKDVNANRLTNMLNEPVKEVTKKIYDNIQDRYFDNQTYDEVEEEEKENTDQDRLNFATTKVIEITNLKRNNSEFVRGIIPPLTTS